MPPKVPSAGDIVDARCSRCKALTNHTIIAMVGDTPAQVQCNTCGGQHKYRKPTASRPASKRSTSTASPSRRSRKDPAVQARETWEAKTLGLDTSTAKPYTMESQLKVSDLVQHKTFGLGIVESVSNDKAEILFEVGIKLLRCKAATRKMI